MIQLKTIVCSVSVIIFLICLCSSDGYVNEKLERKYRSSQERRVEFFENYNRHSNRRETKSKDDGRVAEKLYDRRSFRTGTPSGTKFIYSATYIGNNRDRKTDVTNITSKRNNHITHYRRTRTRDNEFLKHIPQVRRNSYEYESITNNRRYRNTEQNRQIISRNRKFRNTDRRSTESYESNTERRNQHNVNDFSHRKSISTVNIEDINLKNAKMKAQRENFQHTNRRIEHKIPLFESPQKITKVVDIRAVEYIINSEPLDNIILDDSKSHSTSIREIKDKRTLKERRSDHQYSFTRSDEERNMPQNYFFRTETSIQAYSNRQNNVYLIERRQSISERRNEISNKRNRIAAKTRYNSDSYRQVPSMQTNEKPKRLAISNIRRSHIVRDSLEENDGRNLRNIREESTIHMERREARNIENSNSIGRFIAEYRQSWDSRRLIGSLKLIRDTSRKTLERRFIDNTLQYTSKEQRYMSTSITSRDMIKGYVKKVPVQKRSSKSVSSTNNERRIVEGNFSTTINNNLFERRRKEELPDNTIADLVYTHGTFNSTALANTLKLILGFFLLCQIFINSSNKNKSRLTNLITLMKPLNSIKEKVQ